MEKMTLNSTFGAAQKVAEVGFVTYLAKETPLQLECGAYLQNFPIAFQTYGTLNHDRSNAILICHGLTGDQYVAGVHPVTERLGWWDNIVGPGKILDTERYYIICANVIGGCMGSLGPKETNPQTGKPYNLSFPVLTIRDMVRAQHLLIGAMGIPQLFAIIGASMGGMQVLEWATLYPEKLFSVILIATAARHTAQNIAFHEIGRQSIMADPEWREGNYLNEGTYPTKGLAVARMTAHVTYLSGAALHRKFGRSLQNRQDITYGFEADFQVESYLRHQGVSFVDRFDANSYLYITRAMDYFDLSSRFNQVLSQAFLGNKARFCVIAFSSDWLFPPAESRHIVHALNAAAVDVTFVEVETDKGHDAFLLDETEFHDAFAGFLKGAAKRRKI